MRRPFKHFFKRVLQHPITQSLMTKIGYGYIRFVWMTSHFDGPQMHNTSPLMDADARVIVAFWHGRIAMLPCGWVWKRSFKMLLSQHRDGLLISRILSLFGMGSIFGSTTRGGAKASREILTALAEGVVIGITPDGPKGPPHVCKPGVIHLAHLAAQNLPTGQKGCWIIPANYTITRHRILKSWDHFLFPLPFSKGAFIAQAPLLITPDMSPQDLEDQRVILEGRLNMTETL